MPSGWPADIVIRWWDDGFRGPAGTTTCCAMRDGRSTRTAIWRRRRCRIWGCRCTSSRPRPGEDCSPGGFIWCAPTASWPLKPRPPTPPRSSPTPCRAEAVHSPPPFLRRSWSCGWNESGVKALKGNHNSKIGGEERREDGGVLFSDIAATSAAVTATSGRNAKIELLADALRRLDPSEVPAGSAYLAGELRQRQTGVGYASLRDRPAPAAEPTLTVGAVDSAIAEIASVA